MKQLFSKREIWLILCLLILACVSSLFLFVFQKNGDKVIIYVEGRQEKQLSLFVDTKYVVNTKYGRNVVIIKNHKVSMEDADCPDKICVHHKTISKEGETIVCLPHKLVVQVEGNQEADYDAITR